jgi:hypothetical protein
MYDDYCRSASRYAAVMYVILKYRPNSVADFMNRGINLTDIKLFISQEDRLHIMGFFYTRT